MLIVDEQPVFRFGVRQILNLDKNSWRAIECSDGARALEILRSKKIDFLFLEFKPGEINRLELLAHAKVEFPDLLIVTIGHQDIHPEQGQLNQLGVDSFLPRNCRIEDILEALNALKNGKTYFLYSTKADAHSKGYKAGGAAITKREREILKLIFKEYTNPEIAEMLSISRRTVDTHRKNLLKKMKVKNTAGLIRHALRKGFIQLTD